MRRPAAMFVLCLVGALSACGVGWPGDRGSDHPDERPSRRASHSADKGPDTSADKSAGKSAGHKAGHSAGPSTQGSRRASEADDDAVPRPRVSRSRLASSRSDLTLSCGGGRGVKVPEQSGLEPAGSFAGLPGLNLPVKVEGRIWKHNDERLYVGVVCGVSRPEQFATLVADSTLTAYQGKPALRWITRTGVRNFMWLDRPGAAVYLGATPGLADEMEPLASDITAR